MTSDQLTIIIFQGRFFQIMFVFFLIFFLQNVTGRDKQHRWESDENIYELHKCGSKEKKKDS